MSLSRLLHSSFSNAATRIGTLTALDPVATRLHALVDPILGTHANQSMKDALYGTWLGHPLHPVIVDLPIGFWTSSAVLDVLGMKRGADAMLGFGTVSAVGAALTGYAQWFDVQEMDEPRRIGTLHALLNGAATIAYAGSWLLRTRDQRTAGYLASAVGLSLATSGGLLGGDLSYRLGIGVGRNAFDDHDAGWTRVASVDELPDGELSRLSAPNSPLMALRRGDDLWVTSAMCTHVGAPLDEGSLDGTCVTCPWHGSVFDLRDGAVVHGPATVPLDRLQVRVRDGQVEVSAGA